MHTIVRLGIAVAVTTACASGAAAQAEPQNTQPTTPLSSITACPDGTRADEPVLLIHGTNADVEKSLGPVRAGLLEDGRCVYSLEYDSRQPVSTSVDYFTRATDLILEADHTAAIDLVGKSQGALIARAVSLKFGDRQVNPIKEVVAISGPQHGTAMPIAGLDVAAIAPLVPGLRTQMPALLDMLTGSQYLTELNSGEMTAPGAHYTMIATSYDDIVVPYTSAFIDAPNVTNITVQDGCPEDHVTHVAASNDPRTIALALQALDPQAHSNPRCTAAGKR